MLLFNVNVHASTTENPLRALEGGPSHSLGNASNGGHMVHGPPGLRPLTWNKHRHNLTSPVQLVLRLCYCLSVPRNGGLAEPAQG